MKINPGENGQAGARPVLDGIGDAHQGAGCLELEITESVLLQDNDVNLSVLHRLPVLGVRISMDDFGIGYSSLSYLRRFPFDKIKIDQSFARNLEQKRGNLVVDNAGVNQSAA